jgi:hypothetical protein
MDLFTLTTALVDADGRLWQRTRTISVSEIWGAILRRPVLYRLFDQPSNDPMYCNAESVTRHIVFEPVATMADHREHHLIEIILQPDGNIAPGKGSIPYADARRLLFRFRFKYFGARIGLIEDQPTFRIHNSDQVSRDSRLLVTIEPTTDSDMIVALNQQDKIVPSGEVALLTLGTLCSHDARLGAGLEKPGCGLATPGNLAAWQHGFSEAGGASALAAFKPNPAIRYEPRPGR